jgi:hypothetical protein
MFKQIHNIGKYGQDFAQIKMNLKGKEVQGIKELYSLIAGLESKINIDKSQFKKLKQ